MVPRFRCASDDGIFDRVEGGSSDLDAWRKMHAAAEKTNEEKSPISNSTL